MRMQVLFLKGEALGELVAECVASGCVEGVGLAEVAGHSVHVVSLSQSQVHNSISQEFE